MLNIEKNIQPKYAFFDVDETVISMKSMFSFMDIYFSHNKNILLEERFHNEMSALIKSNTDRNVVNAKYYSFFKYFPISSVKNARKAWFDTHSSRKELFYNKKIIKELELHQNKNIACVFVSGSFKELLQPIADDLGVEHILSINLERDGERYTGNIIPPQTIGDGKADAINLFLDARGGDAKNCYAYGDDISDVPMLSVVGNPVAVAGGRRLESYAKERGWPIIQPN
jgi:HAD superfamily hydrolase (TIGR01490 family)